MGLHVKRLATGILCAVLLNCVQSQTLQDWLKMAQCRANCLDTFKAVGALQNDDACRRNASCSTCWENCNMLAHNYPIWSITCGQANICDSGCQTACDFHSSHPGVVALSQHNSRLTLVFSGPIAEWSLTWGKDAPKEHVVFALFTREPGRSWKLHLQTADFGASLDSLVPGTDLKLVAVAESGVLSVIITPYAPLPRRKGSVKATTVSLSTMSSDHTFSEVNSIDAGLGFPLLHVAEVEDSGLVTSKIWWEPQGFVGADYLVTWEVSGGGLKGHLYTDIPEVELTLWPETIYQVQVEVVAGPFGDLKKSMTLTLDTHNITIEAQKVQCEENEVTPTLPLVHKFDPSIPLEVILGVSGGVVAATLVVVFAVYRRRTRRSSPSSLDIESEPATKWGGWNRTLCDVTLDESLVKNKSNLDDTSKTVESECPLFTFRCVDKVQADSALSSSLSLLQRNTHVNLYSLFPPPDVYKAPVLHHSPVSNI